MQRFEKLKTHLLLLGFIELVILIITQIFLKQALAIIQYVLILLNLLIVFILFTTSRKSYQDRVLTVTRALGKESGEAFAYEIGRASCRERV